jgi:hypothetical protein
MGWTEGKGLGKRENGIQQHIKVELKSDNKGLVNPKFVFQNKFDLKLIIN